MVQAVAFNTSYFLPVLAFPGSHPLACTNQPEALASSDVYHMAVNIKMARRVERNIGSYAGWGTY
jgi:hypothetical protein